MAGFCFSSSRFIPINGLIVDNTRTFFFSFDLYFGVYIHNERSPSIFFQCMVLSNWPRCLAFLRWSSKPVCLVTSVPTTVILFFKSQFAVEIDVYPVCPLKCFYLYWPSGHSIEKTLYIILCWARIVRVGPIFRPTTLWNNLIRKYRVGIIQWLVK